MGTKRKYVLKPFGTNPARKWLIWLELSVSVTVVYVATILVQNITMGIQWYTVYDLTEWASIMLLMLPVAIIASLLID